MTAQPAYATAPTPGAQHYAVQVGKVAAMLGTPLMPWQQQVARVATEVAADGLGWRYPVVVVSVPRQSGKTTLMRSVLTQRAIQRPGLVAFYTAQTGKDASARWHDLVEAVEQSPLSAYVTKRLAAGSQALSFPNGSRIHPFAPTPKSLHGYTPPLVMLDEAFAHDELAGRALEGAVKPAQITLVDRQLWIVSTMGTAESTWFHRWVEAGRSATSDPASGVAFFEWSAPAGANLYDPAVWWTYHPALGHTITEAALASDAETTPPGEWERAYGNRRSETSEPILDLAVYDRMGRPDDLIPKPVTGRPVGLAYDLAHDRSEAAIWASWLTTTGQAVLKCIRSAPGIYWVADGVQEALALIPGAVLGAHELGPVRQATDELRRRGVTVNTLTSRDWPTACGAWHWRATHDLLIHDNSPAMRAAIMVAATRPAGEAWALSLTHSAGSIAALGAGVVALRLTETRAEQPRPVIITGAAA